MEFVTFEIAKKLKEKGFNVPCIYAYCEQGGWNKYTQKREPITYILRTDGNPFGTYYTGNNWNKKYETNKNKIQCSAPTISQVLKWLREVHNVYIDISIYIITKDILKYNINVYHNKNRKDLMYSGIHLTKECSKYEEACEVALEYVLDNLI